MPQDGKERTIHGYRESFRQPSVIDSQRFYTSFSFVDHSPEMSQRKFTCIPLTYDFNWHLDLVFVTYRLALRLSCLPTTQFVSKVILPGCNRGIITCLEHFDSSCYGVIEDSLQKASIRV
ncbi:hypothetical protein ACLB2K_050215 [Fragaria x ananassa]